ncbi:Uncharacterized conserved protein [Delftia tsuruhatensis]|uniref:DUF1254 domain-containing protein n=1 Tax=Delftia tsuruhatensis TaxID=180282 RepID=UPI001E6B852C|nr:DUF1254 domain-containing protein [Delftia tsuruhatensis]CAB5713046.1 Uncharacterized conserved protein [Delftia tsuruhatensis]CAC9691879.1 Uncharacterized conserved protein [Delftia tsuruhatensis]
MNTPAAAARDATASLVALAEEAVVYTYPLYEMARMRAATSPRRQANGEPAGAALRWCNQFVHARQLLRAGTSRVVTPNNDTLYTNAWLDLGAGPLVIDVPDTAGRYYVLGLLDFFTNPFAHIGQRLTGTAARSFLVTPPGWQGRPPAPFDTPGAHIAAPTPWLWVIGRILVDGPDDLPAVHALQDGFSVRPLADWQAGATPSARRFDPGCDPQAPATATHYAAQVNAALRGNPPPGHESARVARFAKLGLGSALAAPDAAQCAALQQALDQVLPRLRAAPAGRRLDSGWDMPPRVEDGFGDDYLARAQVALKYIGMLDSREAVYPMAWHDARGRPLHGSRRYRLRFAPGALPPVQAFWSLTLYGAHDYMLVDNPLDRYAIGDRTPGLRRDADGGLTLHIRHGAPAAEDARANWLPAPPDGFYLCLRAYVPGPGLQDGRHALPPLEEDQETP